MHVRLKNCKHSLRANQNVVRIANCGQSVAECTRCNPRYYFHLASHQLSIMGVFALGVNLDIGNFRQ